MTRPRRYLTRMSLFLIFVLITVIALLPAFQRAFLANAALNGLIVGVLLIGIIYTFRQVVMLGPELDWIENFRREDAGAPISARPILLAPMATMMAEQQGRFSLSTLSLRSLLDGISARLDEARDISRYLIGLLIFLGLLGTFWGLLGTLGSVADTINSLSVSGTDFGVMFEDLKRGLSGPLSGMGTAFSSSLFGLAGSLVLGFLDLQAGQAQNRFFNDLEEWLSGLTRIGAAGPGIATDASVPAYVSALLEQTADSLQKLERIFAHSEEARAAASEALMALAEKIAALTDQMQSEQELMSQLAKGQEALRPVLSRLGETLEQIDARQSGTLLDEASREHLRNLDVHLARLAGEVVDGRTRFLDEIRAEIRLLARTIAAVQDQG